jgi:Carboxypeptidase regulatory-like domain
MSDRTSIQLESNRMRKFVLAVLAIVSVLGAPFARAQSPAPPGGTPATRASVSGIIYDSLARTPLAGAAVQLVNADSLSLVPRTAVSDARGRYFIDSVPRGRYLVGFLHPMLDSLGLEPKPREVSISTPTPVRVDLALPSPRTVRLTICGPAAVADSDALIIGVVRRASDRMGVDSAVVTADWVDLVLEAGAFRRSTVRRKAEARESGWYALCGAPSAATINLTASYRADSTVTLELEVPANGYMRRDLFFGTARVVGVDSSAPPSDTVFRDRRPRLAGDGKLSGTVVAANGGRPLAGARVSIANGASTRTNELGEWTLSAIPTGTRVLDVRAVAHVPMSLPVAVLDDAPPVRVAMTTVQSMLDTIRVTATRGGNRNLMDFTQRRRQSGAGKFVTGEEIAARRPTYTADLLRTIPGVYVERDRNGDEILTMRGNASGRCRASVFLNRQNLRDMTVNDINSFVRPNELIGIEVYNGIGAPAGFSEYNGCGSIVFTTR